ncbi:MAG TPA: hypothetical protein VLH40_06775 [Atribacteraceae bacterium]|nr:hypothetical protein [Atribacteraceae bacterium]
MRRPPPPPRFCPFARFQDLVEGTTDQLYYPLPAIRYPENEYRHLPLYLPPSLSQIVAGNLLLYFRRTSPGSSLAT